MKLLLDTHLLLWAAQGSPRLSRKAAALIDDPANELLFSAASVWEVAIKNGLKRDDFQADPALLRRGLIDNGYIELPVTGQHAAAVASLPPMHKDPFDRMLLAQASVEGVLLLTADGQLASFGAPAGPVRQV